VTVQIVTNLVHDPRGANTDVFSWGYGFADNLGQGAGSDAAKFSSGSPFLDCTTYVKGGIAAGSASPGVVWMQTELGSEQVSITPGATYSVRIEGMVDQVITGMTIALVISFTTADGSALVSKVEIPQAAPVANAPSVFTTQVVAPQGAGGLLVQYAVTVPIGSAITGSMYATGAMVIPQNASDAPYDGPYFDGDTPSTGVSTFQWLGVPTESASQEVINLPNPPAPPKSPTIVPVATFRAFRQLNISDWEVDEDATPLDPSSTSGGVGQITLHTDENDDTEYLRRVPIDFSVPSQGVTRGTVLTTGATDGVAQIVANSRLDQLNVTRNAAPFSGTFAAGITYYLGLCGLTTGIVIDADLQDVAVSWPGWTGVVWEQVKKVCSAMWVEVSLVSDNVVVRNLRQRTAQNYRDSSVGWNFSDDQIAQTVEGFYFEGEYSTSVPVYPTGGWDEKVQIFSGLAANTVTTQTISLMPTSGQEGPWASLSDVQQPIAVSNVAIGDMSASQYAIIAGDNSQYDPIKWARLGGSVTAEVGPDSRSVIITIVTPDDGASAPFSLATINTDQDNQPQYNSLRIIGTGIAGQKVKISLSTGRTADETATVVGATVENEFIQSRQQLRECLLWTAAAYSGAATLSVTTGGINRLGDSGSYRYPTIGEWDVEYAGKTLADFNTLYASKTAAAVNEDQYELVQQDFANQAFGNIAGARVLHDYAYYRITTANNSPQSITYSATRDTTLEDFDEVWDGKTLADYNALWNTYRAMDAGARPLRTA
jgi:hypothetical protein